MAKSHEWCALAISLRKRLIEKGDYWRILFPESGEFSEILAALPSIVAPQIISPKTNNVFVERVY
jgi:hypothetical protein